MAFVKGESFADAFEGPMSADEILLDYIIDICIIVHDRMEELGIDQHELAKRMGKKDSQISRLLSGEANFTLKTLAQLDAALELGLKIQVGDTAFVSDTVTDDGRRLGIGKYGVAPVFEVVHGLSCQTTSSTVGGIGTELGVAA